MEAANKVVTTAVERLSEAAELVKINKYKNKKEEEIRNETLLFIIDNIGSNREKKKFLVFLLSLISLHLTSCQ